CGWVAGRAGLRRARLGGHLRGAGDRARRRYGGTRPDTRRRHALHRRRGVLRVAPAEPVAEDVRPPRVLPCLHAARRAVPPGRALLCPVPLAPAGVLTTLHAFNSLARIAPRSLARSAPRRTKDGDVTKTEVGAPSTCGLGRVRIAFVGGLMRECPVEARRWL